MIQSKAPDADRITVLVFKDNFAARTFKVSLGWISRLGALLGVILLIALVSTVFALKNYRALRHTDPSHVNELEQELAGLKSAYQALEAKKAAEPEIKPAETLPAQVPAANMTAAAPPAPVATQAEAPATAELFASFPKGTQAAPDFGSPTIAIDSPKVTWSGRNLQVRFNIQYVQTQGSQQGRIVLIARGPRALLGYPDGIFAPSASGYLVSPDKGEYFSLSRFREVRADLGTVVDRGSLREVEAYLFNQHGQLLIHRTIPIEASPAERPAPARKATPVAPEPPAQPATQPDTPAAEPPASGETPNAS
ncbi:MAG: hypothetical protein NDJ89_00135 [Oligoflexia bacterium]|nr:hypothetical protein [Oligoflexia bacterium]